MTKLLGKKGLRNPIWVVVNRSFDNYPDAEEVIESLKSMGIDVVVKRIRSVLIE